MGIIHLYVCCYRFNRGTVIWYSNISLRNKAKLQTIFNIFIKINIYYNELKTTQHGFNIFINNCLFNIRMFTIQHKEHVEISHDSYIRKPRLFGNFLGNERVRINEVSLYYVLKYENIVTLYAIYVFDFYFVSYAFWTDLISVNWDVSNTYKSTGFTKK